MSMGNTFFSYSHSLDDVEFSLSALEEICKHINDNVINEDYENLLEGNLPKPVYADVIPSTKKRK